MSHIFIFIAVALFFGIVAALCKSSEINDKIKKYNIRSAGEWQMKYLGGILQVIAYQPTDSILIIDESTNSLCFLSTEGVLGSKDGVKDILIRIPLEKIQSISAETKESLSAGKMLLIGIYALALKDKENYLRVSYTNDIGETENALFATSVANVVAQIIMQKRYEILKTNHPIPA